MTDDQQERLRALEVTVAEIRVRQTEIAAQVEATSQAVAAIKVDTADIVRLLQGASVLGRISKWVAAIVGGYLAGKGLKWW
jgi:hypothetical protein